MSISPEELRRVVVFEQATDADLLELLHHSVTRTIEEGSFFFFQGDPADHFYILTEGQVKLLQSNPGGQQVNLRTVYPWQAFGALGAVRKQALYPASAQALQDSAALAISSEKLKGMLRTRPAISAGLMQLMTDYIGEMQARYRELATERVQQRIARTLLRLASQSGQKVDQGIEINLSHQDLAEMSGTTLFTVSRVLAEWERQGIVVAGREHIRIPKPHDLVTAAEGTGE